MLHLLRPGANVLGLVLTDGWYAGRIAMLGRSAQYGDLLRATWELTVDDADGGIQTIVPDASVVSARGPIDWSDIFIGERHDARLRVPGWATATFEPSGWTPCRLVDVDTRVHPFIGEPVRRVMELPVQTVAPSSDGGSILDFGQVIAGRVRFTLTAARGTVVRLEHSEALTPAGDFFNNLVGANKDQVDEYVFAGDADGESWEPEHTFHGFRYVKVTGLASMVEAKDFTAVVVASDLEETADLRTSDARLNQLVSNTRWSQRGNFLAIPTDCPQRERAGWTGDLQVFAPTAATLMGVAAFLERWLRNLRIDQQQFDGVVPDVVPMPPAAAIEGRSEPYARASAGWGDVVTIAPWALYRHYGDDRVLSDNLDAMLQWIDVQRNEARTIVPPRLEGKPLTREQRARNELLWNGPIAWGDWLAPSTAIRDDEDLLDGLMRGPKLTSEYTGPAFQVLSLETAASTASVLGRHAIAEQLTEEAAAVRAAFAAEYLEVDGRIGPDMQGVYVLALATGLVPDHRRTQVAQRLVDAIRSVGDHLDTGFVSIPYLLDVLWEHGYKDVARTLLFQDTVPSWLYEVRMGATSIWESWDAVGDDGIVKESSLNHYAFGCVVDWMMRRIAGIAILEPAYRVTAIRPDLDGPLTWCAAHVDTPYGRFAVEWSRDGDLTQIDVEVPSGAEARIELSSSWSCDVDVLGPGRHRLAAHCAIAHHN